MAERITENLVRDKLRDLGYRTQDNGITIEEQKSEIAKVKGLLAKSSKNSVDHLITHLHLPVSTRRSS